MTAVVTAPGASALASIEIHGPDTVDIARRLFHSAGVHPNFGRERGQYYGRFGREVVDDVVLAVLDPLASDPGDNAVFPTVQVHCHGGSAMTRSLMNEIQSLGAKVVDWRELMAARGVHWTRIEAAEALGQCKAWRAAAVLLDQWNGSLERAFHAPLPLSTSDATVRNVGNTQRELAESVLQWWEFGRRLVEGWRIMLLGRPNVGKSMLLNALLGYERVIVHDLPGTTRDVIEVEAALDGWPVRLCDAAGLRDSTDPIEQAGVEKAREWAQSADLRILVYDVSEEFDERDPMRSQVHPHIVLGNKTDLAIRWNKQQLRELDLLVSAETSAGLDRLLEAMVTRIVPNAPALGQPIPFTSRQVEWLKTFLNADGQPLSQK